MGGRREDTAEAAGGGEEGLHTKEDHQDREKEGEEREREGERGVCTGRRRHQRGTNRGAGAETARLREAERQGRDRDRQREGGTDVQREDKRMRETEAAAETMADAGKRLKSSQSHFGA